MQISPQPNPLSGQPITRPVPPAPPAAGANVAAPPAPQRLRFTATDLTPDGKLPIIVLGTTQNPLNQKTLDRCKQCCEHKGKGEIQYEFETIPGFAARIDPSQVKAFLKDLPPGAKVTVDHKIEYPAPPAEAPSTGISRPKSAPVAPNAPTDVAMATLGMNKVWDKGYTGKGVGIAIIDSGIYPHPDLKDRIVAWQDFVGNKPDPYDDFGHGTHVAGDAAGSGKMSNGLYRGAAPDANLIGLKIASESDAIKAIDWAIKNKEKYNIRVINMSLGVTAMKSYKDDPWAQAAEKATRAGIVVAAAAGNEGPGPNTISTPGIDPSVITVGSLDDKQTMSRSDDTVADSSSRGPTPVDRLTKPDVLAPGVQITSTLSPGSTLDMPDLPHVGQYYFTISGTSMATPIVAGLAADLIQANPALTPDQVKAILTKTADALPNYAANVEGAGVIDPGQALDAAKMAATDPKKFYAMIESQPKAS